MLDSLTLSVTRQIPTGSRRTAAQPADETALVDAARSGDHGAFGDLVRRHQARVFRLAGRFFRRPEDLDDVAQEVFLRAWSKLDTYRGEAPFEHWLTRLCLNLCYQRLRRNEPSSVPIEHASGVPARRLAAPDAGLDAARWLAHATGSGPDRYKGYRAIEDHAADLAEAQPYRDEYLVVLKEDAQIDNAAALALGRAYLRRNTIIPYDPGAAIAVLQTIIATNETGALDALGQAQRALGQFDEAAETFRAAIAVGDIDAMFELAEMALASTDPAFQAEGLALLDALR
ncbi:MAG: sigma-70 family RNA polymerase sigma factor, partial [Acidobacteriota bacterium]